MITKRITVFGDVPGTIQRNKLVIVLVRKVIVWLIRSQLEGLLGHMRMRNHLLF